MSIERPPVHRGVHAALLSAVLVGGLTTAVAATSPAVGSEQAGYQVLRANLRPAQ